MSEYIAIIHKDREHWFVEIMNRTGQAVAGAQLDADRVDEFVAHYEAEIVSDARGQE